MDACSIGPGGRSIVRGPLAWMVFTLLLTCPSPICGQENASQWWNPLSWADNDPSVRKSSYFSGSGKSSGPAKPLFSLPKLPRSGAATQEVAAAPSSTAPTQPTVLGKLGQSTKRAWNNTLDFMNPFDQASETKPSEYQPLHQGYQPQNSKSTSKSSGLFGWMWREETPEEPASVNEFLRQERPRF